MSPVLLALATAFAALEGYDLSSYGVTVPSLLKDATMEATKTSAGRVGSLVAVGMLVGAALSAVLIRRLGSRRLIFAGATIFSLGTVACASATAFSSFGVARLFVGVGLGVVLPTLTAYVADLSAPDRRSRNVGMMMAGYASGALLAPLAGAVFLPDSSWRWLYLGGAIPAVILLPVAARLLPESPVTPTRTGPSTASAGDMSGLRSLFAPGVRLATVLFWSISFCGLLLVFGISTWLPTIMQAAGYTLGSALLQTAAMWVGAGIGMVAGGRIADAVGVKPVVVVAFLAGSAGLLVMSARPSLGVLFLAMGVSGLGFIGSQVLTNAFIVTRYPDHLRGVAIGWALSVGRLGAVAGPVMGAAILSSSLDVGWNFYLFAIPGLVGAGLAALVPVIRSSAAPAEVAPAEGMGVTQPAP
jgi:AAHS family benzoate transporter-like MFS transporter